MLQKIRGIFSHTQAKAPAQPQQTNGFVDSRDCGLVDAIRSGWYLNDTDELFKGFKIRPEDIVLDVGCGGGGATLFCARRGARVIFTDLLAEKIERLNELVKQTPVRDPLGFVSDSNPLPLPNATATRVIALEMLEHVENPKKVMQELVRVGKPGALYLLAVPDALGEHIQKDLAPKNHFERPNHIHIFEREDFSQLVSDTGLIIERHEFCGFFWTIWMFIYWSHAKTNSIALEGASHDVIQPPYPPILNDWAKLWRQLLDMPDAMPMKHALDNLLPKSQVIVARKPSLET